LTGEPGRLPTTKLLDAADAGPVPIAFVPVTVQRYALPLVRPVTVSGDPAPVLFPAAPPLLDVQVTVYEVTVLPRGGAGPKVTVAAPLAGATLAIVGAPGTAAPTTTAEGADAGLVPTPLVAVTVQR
jgi:hypothetical protein